MNRNREQKNIPIKENVNDNFLSSIFSNQKIVALLILGATILILFPLAKSYSERKIIEKEIFEIKEKIDKYEKGNEELNEFLMYLDSKQAIEDQARTSLNMKKSGEGVIVIEELTEEEKQEAAKKIEESQKSNFRKWIDYFFN